MKPDFRKFANLYPLSKTLRFELIPQGNTLNNIKTNGLITEDEKRAQDYKKVKEIINQYHQKLITETLQGLKLSGLEQYVQLYLSKNKENQEEIAAKLEQSKNGLRKQITEAFKNNPKFGNLFKKELIKIELLKESYLSDEDKRLIKKFSDFTTYFVGFHENRKNIYTDEPHSTAIAFRLIHQNLDSFIDNIDIFQKKIASSPILPQLQKAISTLSKQISLEEVFSIGFFNQTLTQEGIDLYNYILGGASEDETSKIQGLNEIINLYNQQHKKDQLPKFKMLYKQILSESQSQSYIPAKINNDIELCHAITSYHSQITEKIEGQQNLLEKLEATILNLENYDLDHIYINGYYLNTLSQQIFGSWEIIRQSLREYYQNNFPATIKNQKNYEEKMENWLKQKCFSLKLIDDALSDYAKVIDDSNISQKIITNTVVRYIIKTNSNNNSPYKKAELGYAPISKIISEVENENNIAKDKDKTSLFKNYLDSQLEILHLIKSFIPKTDGLPKEDLFYSELQGCLLVFENLTALYNQVRNYLTQKPYSTEKFKLNFQNSQLLAGWDKNKETSNTAVLLIKDQKYYLGIMDKKHNKLFESIPVTNDSEYYDKVVYKLLPGANKMLPKVFLSEKGKKTYQPSAELLTKYKLKTHIKGETFNIQDCHNLIDYFKACINKHPDWEKFNFNFSKTEEYKDISGFYREVENQGYKLSFEKVAKSYIDKCVEEGKLYLFRIYNKDFSEFSKGTPNLHTLFWQELFSEKNLKDVIFKLNGEAEIFYRKASINEAKRVVHHNKYKIAKKTFNGQRIDDSIIIELNQYYTNRISRNQLSQEAIEYIDNYSLFDGSLNKQKIDLVKDHRYTQDKFQFHVPITINFKANGNDKIDLLVREYLKTSTDTHIIGIDRGERHLLYISVIDPNGNIVEQFSLNEIINEYNGHRFTTNYQNLLDKKQKGREQQRLEWNTIENIKELKEGYLSQVINKICKLVVKYNAIIIMEDLNTQFKRGRIKVEKQIYQKFEKMLIQKLNFLAFKTKQNNEPGIRNALQLSSKFEGFNKLGKQSGIIFYVSPWNTSKIDPVTGFVDFLKPKYENLTKSQEFFSKFDAIRYNSLKDWFEFNFNYKNFTTKAEGTRLDWTICSSNDERYYWERSKNGMGGSYTKILITQELKKLFDDYSINYIYIDDLKDEICNQQSASFHKKLTWLLSLLLSMRYNNGLSKEDEEDYILSPIADNCGNFFDSRKQQALGKNAHGQWIAKLPVDSDANGAFNIARKGLWLIQEIKKAEDIKKVKLAISNKEWLEFVQH